MAWLTPDELLRTPVDQLGVLIAHRFNQLGEGSQGLHNFTVHYLEEVRPRTPGAVSVYTGGDLRANKDAIVQKIAEAWAWLEREGYLVLAPRARHGDQWRVLTERGQQLISRPVDETLQHVKAAELLGDDLHPRIEQQVRREWIAGDYETAIFKAAREVEIAVGEALGAAKGRAIGVTVMNTAFKQGGPLVDPAQDPGEQEGTRSLYTGFIGVFKNPGSHRHWQPDDPVQAAEIIRPADLLMRMLDDRVGA